MTEALCVAAWTALIAAFVFNGRRWWILSQLRKARRLVVEALAYAPAGSEFERASVETLASFDDLIAYVDEAPFWRWTP